MFANNSFFWYPSGNCILLPSGGDMADSKELQIGEKFAGRYRVVEIIGEGPVGKVYKALDLALDIPVAVKIIKPGLFTGEFSQVNIIRLYRARAYKNPALLEILEVQPDGPVPFVTSALAQGLSLRQVMDFHHETGEAFTVMKIRSFMERIFEGMEFIHTMGVHGNIKPENIFILSTHLAIADPYYIIEKRLREGEEIPVTDFYRPPEQLNSPQKDLKASDIYSMAMVMGELVSNGPVQPGISLSEQTPRLTSRFDAAFMRATLENPKQRQESVAEFAKEMFDALASVEQEGLWERKHHETGSFKAVKVPDEPAVEIEKLPEIEKTEEKESVSEEPERKVTQKLHPIADVIEEKPAAEEAPLKIEEPPKPEEATEKTEPTEEPPEIKENEEKNEPVVEEDLTPPPVTETEADDLDEIEEIEEETTLAIPQDELPVEPAAETKEEDLEELEEIDEVPEIEEYEELNDDELVEAPGVDTEAVVMDDEPEDTLVETVEEVEKVAEQPVPVGKMAGFDKVTTSKPEKKKENDKTYLWVGIGVAVLVVILALAFSGNKKDEKKTVKTKGTAPITKVKKDATIAKDTTKKIVAKDAAKKIGKDVTAAVIKKKDAVADATKTKDVKKAADTKPAKKTDLAKKQPEKPARKPGFIYASDLKCPAGMAKVTVKKEAEEKPGLKLTKLAYCIDRYEYPGRGKMPMGKVSAGKAARLCKKAGKRLCTTNEWKRACGSTYPYGTAFVEGTCNVASNDGTAHTIAPAGTYNKCKSPYGVYDMVGNVEEWTSSRRLFGGNATTAGQATTCARSTKRFLPNKFSGFRCCANPNKGNSK